MAKAEWRKLEHLKTGAVRPWSRKRLLRCDPYLVWADAVTLPSDSDQLRIAVLVELVAAEDYLDFLKRLNPDGFDLDRLRFLPNGFEPSKPTRFITGLVTRMGLDSLICEVLSRTIERFSLQDSREDIARTTVANAQKFQMMWTEAVHSAGQSSTSEEVTTGASAPATYLGIVDDGLPVLRLRDAIQLANKPAHFWDQGWQPLTSVSSQIKPQNPPDPSDLYWRVAWEFLLFLNPADPAKSIFEPPRGFLYGRRLKTMPSRSGPSGQNDRDEYALSRYFAPAPRQSHGAAVLGLLAPWISGAREPVKWPEHIAGLAMVQLPTRTVLDTSGGSLAMRVLDGLRFILWQEANDRPDRKVSRQVVSNVSYGVHAGPHDGTSMFERAVAEMLDANPHLHLVLPVGNAARAGCHARRSLAKRGKAGDAATVVLQVLPDSGRDTFVEIWLPPGAKVALSIRPPGSPKKYEIREGEARINFDPAPDDPDVPKRVHFGAVYSKEVAQGTRGTMALVAIGATKKLARSESLGFLGVNQQERRDVLGAPGLWTLRVKNLTADSFMVDAWIERGDAPPDLPLGSRQAFFPDTCCETVRLDNSTAEDTLNGIATLKHERLHVVGAMRADGALSDYSAAGSGRAPAARIGPDVVVTADWSKNLPGVRTIGFVRGAVARVNGTSAACAVYARALARQLSVYPTKPPSARKPGDPPPEIDCVTDSQPEADPRLRGHDERRDFPFEVDL